MVRRAKAVLVRCRTAADFLQRLSPDHEWFYNYEPQSWIFRGHADADWPLEPSAFRYVPDGMEFRERTNLQQIALEIEAIRPFFGYADAAGLAIPEDSQRFREVFERACDHDLGKYDGDELIWPPRELWSLLAIAQHHQIPTRLLDWTWSPYVAPPISPPSMLRLADKCLIESRYGHTLRSGTRLMLTSMAWFMA